jgi:hypothetical protein
VAFAGGAACIKHIVSGVGRICAVARFNFLFFIFLERGAMDFFLLIINEL